MTKKDYIIIANAIRRVYRNSMVNWHVESDAVPTIERVVERLSVEMSKDNLRFNPEKFKDAIYK